MLPVSDTFKIKVNEPMREWKALVILDFVENLPLPWGTATASSVFDAVATPPSAALNGRFRETDYYTDGYANFMGAYVAPEKGWWSAGVSDDSGNVNEWLEIVYETPLKGRNFWVVGSELNFPVDFVIKWAPDLVSPYQTLETVIGNTKWVWSARTLQDVTVQRIRIEVTKISVANAPVKVLEAGLICRVALESSDLIEFRVLEELGATTSSNPLGLVSANELTLYIRNEERLWSPQNTDSPFYGLIRFDVFVRVFVGLKVTDEPRYEFIPLGRFRTKDWSAPSRELAAVLRGLDRISDLAEEPVPTMRVQENVTMATLWNRLFERLGFQSDEYLVDPDLTQQVEKGWVPKGRLIDALQVLATASLARVSTDRFGRIVVKSILTSHAASSVASFTDATQLFSVDVPQKVTDAFSQVTVKFGKPVVKPARSVLAWENLKLPQGRTTLERVEFSEGPVYQVERVDLIGVNGVTIERFDYGTHDATIVLLNSLDETAVNLNVIASTLDLIKTEYTGVNSEALTLYGERRIEFDNFLIQDINTAKDFATVLANALGDPFSKVTFEARGNPALELGDKVTISDPSDRIGTVEAVLTRAEFTFNGALSATYTAQRPILVYQWVFLHPAFAIKVPYVTTFRSYQYCFVAPTFVVSVPIFERR